MVEEKATSSATRTSSSINDLFCWVKSSIGGLFNSRTKDLPRISQVDAQIDVDGTILLLDVFIRKITGQKYVSSLDKSISLLEAQGYASSITLGFDTLLMRTARSCGIQDVNFNPIPVQATITGHIRNGKFSEISKTLYSSAKEACLEFKQTDKFLDRLKDEFLAEKEVELLVGKQKSLPKTISNDKLVHQVKEDKPKSLLSDLAIENSSARRIRQLGESSFL